MFTIYSGSIANHCQGSNLGALPTKAPSDWISFEECRRAAIIDFFDDGRAQIRWTEEEDTRCCTTGWPSGRDGNSPFPRFFQS
jgi:hypothetical protein